MLAAVQRARNARRLLALPELREDVTVCLQRATTNVLAELGADGVVRRVSE